MGDNVTVDNGGLTDFVVSSDEASSGQVQRFKLAYSADGSDTHVTADSSGLLVNLGTNNDVTLTSGTVTIGGGTAYVGGTASVNIVGGTATIAGSLAAGTAYIGSTLIGNATTRADMLSLTSGTAVAVGLYDGTGAQVTFTAPIAIAATLTNGTAAYSVGDTMGTTVTLTSASAGASKTGHIVGARCFVAGDVSAQNLRFWVFDSSVTPSADNAAFVISTTDIVKTQGVISFEDWYDGGTAHVSVGTLTPAGHPLAYITSGAANLYGVMESRGTGTYATATVSVELIALRD